MNYFPEKNRQFVDKGKVKVYSSQLTYPESKYFLAFQKKILKSGHIETINDRRKNNFKIIILLNDKLELKLKETNLKIIDSCTVLLYIAKGENKVTLKNISSGEVEFLEVVLNSVLPPSLNMQFVNYNLEKNSLQMLTSPSELGNSILMGQAFWISKGNFEPLQPLDYKKQDIQNSLYIFLICGEVIINGWTLTYNDAVQLDENDDLMVEFVKPSELLIIETEKR